MSLLHFPDGLRETPFFISSCVCVFITDGFGRALYADPEWLKLIGLTLPQVIDGEWFSLLYPADAERTFREWCAALAHGTIFRESTRIKMSDGSYVKWDCLAYPMLDSHGRIKYWRGILWVGMSEQQAVEQANRRPFELTA